MTLNEIVEKFHASEEYLKDYYRSKFVEEVDKLVRKIAYGLTESTKIMDFDDLVQEGFLASLELLERANVKEGGQFSTLLYIRCKGAMISALRKNQNHARSQSDRMSVIEEAVDELYQRYGRMPSAKEIGEQCDLTEKQVDYTLGKFEEGEVPLDFELESDAEATDSALLRKETNEALFECLSDLPINQRLILILSEIYQMSAKEINLLLDYKNVRYIYKLKSIAKKELEQVSLPV